MEEEELILIVEFCKNYEIEQSFVQSLEEYGLIELRQIDDKQFIHKDRLIELERYIHLHYDLKINMEGLDAIHNLLEKIKNMQHELNELRKRLNIYE
jgi:chaperone modulatory protein CbpM